MKAQDRCIYPWWLAWVFLSASFSRWAFWAICSVNIFLSSSAGSQEDEASEAEPPLCSGLSVACWAATASIEAYVPPWLGFSYRVLFILIPFTLHPWVPVRSWSPGHNIQNSESLVGDTWCDGWKRVTGCMQCPPVRFRLVRLSWKNSGILSLFCI